MAKIDMSEDQVKQFFDFIEEAFKTTIDEIHENMNMAFQPFCQQFFKQNPQKYIKCLDTFVHRIENEKIKDIKKSFCMGISSFPIELIEIKKQEVLEVLKKNCIHNKKIAMNDPEIRKFCVQSLGKIVQMLVVKDKD